MTRSMGGGIVTLMLTFCAIFAILAIKIGWFLLKITAKHIIPAFYIIISALVCWVAKLFMRGLRWLGTKADNHLRKRETHIPILPLKDVVVRFC